MQATGASLRPAPSWREAPYPELTPILAGALEAFSELGYHGTTVRDIAGRVGVTVPALYYHHPSKEAILLALVTLATEDLAWRVEAAAAEAGEDWRQALANIVEAIAVRMARAHKMALLDFEARYLADENRERYAAPRRRIEGVVLQVIRSGVADGVFATDNPREAARALLGSLQWIARWYRPGGPSAPDEIAAQYAALALALVQAGC